MTTAPKKTLVKTVEDAVFEDVKGILEGKPGTRMKAREYAVARWPDDSDPEHMMARFLYCDLAKIVGSHAIKLLLQKALVEPDAPRAAAAE